MYEQTKNQLVSKRQIKLDKTGAEMPCNVKQPLCNKLGTFQSGVEGIPVCENIHIFLFLRECEDKIVCGFFELT